MDGENSPKHTKNKRQAQVSGEDTEEVERVRKDDVSHVTTPDKKAQKVVTLPEYPKHGVIGSKEPVCLNHFYKPKMSSPTNPEDFKRQKFDFHETYEKNCSPSQPYVTPLPGLGNLYRGLKTADLYTIDPALPLRFREPDLLQGYGCERPENPLFRTTSSEYGKLAPTVHDVPVEYHGLKNTFTSHLASTGMPRNRSLNIK